MKTRSSYFKTGPSLCTFCQRYNKRCSWSARFEAVKGWSANVDYTKDGHIRRAWIGSCPEFVPDDYLIELAAEPDRDELAIKLTREYGYTPEVRAKTIMYHVKEYLREVDKC